MVLVLPYDPEWPVAFERIRTQLLAALSCPVRVEHIGSTAVPGLAAKPILDIDVVVATAAEVRPTIAGLARMGFAHQGDLAIAGREAFRPPPDTSPAPHLYLVVDGNQPFRDHMDFRDYLRAHPDAARAYADLKTTLATRFPTDDRADRAAYTTAKAAFIARILIDARRR